MLSNLQSRIQGVIPGVVLSSTVAMAAMFLATQYTAPVMLFALLLGMAFNFVDRDGKFIAGINFMSRTVLRVGVALLGARITFAQILELGPYAVLIVLVSLVSTIGVGILTARLIGRTLSFGVLTGGAVGICGASAALALTSVLPKGESGIVERDTVFTVVAVTVFSTVAMITYPMFTQLAGMSDQVAGIFLGATIHDVAQVVGAGYTVSEQTGDIATVIKLLRVAMLVPVIGVVVLFSLRARKDAPRGSVPVPWFLFGFVALAVLNSLGVIPVATALVLSDASKWALVAAIAALGMKTLLGEIVTVGPRALAIVLIETLWIAGFVWLLTRALPL